MNIETLSLNELRELNKKVCAEIRHKQTLSDMAKTAGLRIGDTVSFKDRYGLKTIGTVSKINLKSVKVNTSRGIWNVSPSFLTKD